jgi:hypothetical protein
MSEYTRVFLSIDWDFFVRSMGIWDWGHRETPFFMSSFVWMERFASFWAQGIDIREEMDPDTHAYPRPDSFWSLLSQMGYDFSECTDISVAESHAAAGPVFYQLTREVGVPTYIVNFDAHHDAGYVKWGELRQSIKAGSCACDTWVCALMCWLDEVSFRIVLPNWMKEECEISEQVKVIHRANPKKMWSRIAVDWFMDPQQQTINSIVSRPGQRLVVDGIFICRSGAWTPPWLDTQFVNFVRGAEREVGVKATWASEGRQIDRELNPMRPREWDVKQAKAFGDMMREQIEAFRNRKED